MSSLVGRAVLAATGTGWMRRLVTGTRAGRAIAHRFVAGDTLDDAVAVVRRLNDAGMTASFDHLGEHVADPVAAVAARDDYTACLQRIAAEGLDANISVKLTQLGLGLDEHLAHEALTHLAKQAAAAATTVTVDMEESTLTDATLDVYAAVQAEHGNLGVAVQAYLYRTPADLERLIPLGGHVRLCKGAYREPSQVAFGRRGEVDTAFDGCLRMLMADPGVVPAIATHDTDRIDLARRLAASRAAPFEFQMLYGVRTPLQRDLVAEGFPLRVYVPYGAAWYPYLTRRLAERPANVWFFARALAGRSDGA
jgi:proline dehydrogenase